MRYLAARVGGRLSGRRTVDPRHLFPDNCADDHRRAIFLALGSHTTRDVPGELGLAPGETTGRINGRTVIYTLPVGVGGDLDQAVLELARNSGAPLREPSTAGVWDGFPDNPDATN